MSRWRLALESGIVSLFGLSPLVFKYVENRASMMGQDARLVRHVANALGGALDPGSIVGELIGGLLDIGGFTTNWAWLRTIEDRAGTIANCLLFAVVWAIVRGRPASSRLRRATIVISVIWACGVAGFLLVMGYLFGGS